MALRPKKLARLGYCYLKSKFTSTPVFLRIIPTDRCNLQCKYCFQRDNNSHVMTKEEFDAYLDKAAELGTSIVSFLGGEPMIWPHLYYAIEQCTKRGILTEMTTNATLLSDKNLDRLGKAGLDMLDLSVDSVTNTSQSKKNHLTKTDLSKRLDIFRKRYRVNVRLNAVLTKDNIKDIDHLMAFCKKLNYPLSLGFVVPPIFKKDDYDGEKYLFTKEDYPDLKKAVSLILRRKHQGYHIIDPDSYFKGVFDFLEGKNGWDCSYSRKTVSGITIAPDGRLRTCTKLMDYTSYRFLDMTPEKIKEARNVGVKVIEKCNPVCYSNCAFNAFYYNQHKMEFLFRNVLPSIKHIYKK